MKKLRLVTRPGYVGYYLSDLQQILSPEEYKALLVWLRGQTIGIYRKKEIIYKWDYDQFMNRKRPWD